MNYLLDTQIFLWSLGDSTKISKKAQSLIINPEHTIYVSIASLWEIAIKMSIGKLTLTQNLDEVMEGCKRLDFRILPVSLDALRLVKELPFLHRDPFDRLIIAQANAEKFTLISTDHIFSRYEVNLIS